MLLSSVLRQSWWLSRMYSCRPLHVMLSIRNCGARMVPTTTCQASIGSRPPVTRPLLTFAQRRVSLTKEPSRAGHDYLADRPAPAPRPTEGGVDAELLQPRVQRPRGLLRHALDARLHVLEDDVVLGLELVQHSHEVALG